MEGAAAAMTRGRLVPAVPMAGEDEGIRVDNPNGAPPEVSQYEEFKEWLHGTAAAGGWAWRVMAQAFTVLSDTMRLSGYALGIIKVTDPVGDHARKQAAADHAASVAALVQSEQVASSASSVRYIARRLADSAIVDPEVWERLTPETAAWLRALTTDERERVASASFRQLRGVIEGVGSIEGVRTPDDVERGVAPALPLAPDADALRSSIRAAVASATEAPKPRR